MAKIYNWKDEACKKIFVAKGRAQDNPLIVHVSNKEMIYNIVEKPNKIEEKLIDSFMPVVHRKNQPAFTD